MLEIEALLLDAAALTWERLNLPEFEVKGYLDGQNKTWTVPEVLRQAAKQIRERG